MCLIVDSRKRSETVKEDIICYKFLKRDRATKKLLTPYRFCHVRIGDTYKSSLRKKGSSLVFLGLHSFENLEDAISVGKFNVTGMHYTLVLTKCTIPKKSKVYKGTFHDRYADSYSSYASNKLAYNEIIDELYEI